MSIMSTQNQTYYGSYDTQEYGSEFVEYYEKVLRKFNISYLPTSDQSVFILELNRVAQLRFDQFLKSDISKSVNTKDLYIQSYIQLLKDLLAK